MSKNVCFSMIFLYISVDQDPLDLPVDAVIVSGWKYTDYFATLNGEFHFRFFIIAPGNMIQVHTFHNALSII